MLFKIKATVQVKKKKGKTGKPFNPLTFDVANLLALYDGDLDLSNVLWADQSANGYDLTLFNNPTIVAAAINGHDAIQFDGINQYGTRALTPAQNQPITKYLVFKQITWTVTETIVDSNNGNAHRIYQDGLTPQLRTYSGVVSAVTNPNIPLNTYDILTTVFNGANSEIRTNNNAAVITNAGLGNGTGITLAAFGAGAASWSNCEIAHYIIRQGADSPATQNLFINWLKNRFAI